MMEYKGLPLKGGHIPELDRDFVPLGLFFRTYQAEAKHPFAVAVEGGGGQVTVYETALRDPMLGSEADRLYVDRLVKCLLWMWGGWKVTICGSDAAWEQLRQAYAPGGSRAFDEDFMSRVYEHPFQVERCSYEDRPRNVGGGEGMAGNLEGCRIGIDLGGSNIKVSAVQDGQTVCNESFPWQPKVEADPQYHYDHLRDAVKTMAAKLPRVDGVGISSAGVFIENRCMVASLFLAVSREDFDRKSCKDLYIRAVADAVGKDVPLTIANDGDVTALAGSLAGIGGALLGTSLGTAQAGGYVTETGAVTGWLNEFAFVPIDARADVAIDPWSGDGGCGVNYLSQDGTIRLAPLAGLEPVGDDPSAQFRYLRAKAEAGDDRGMAIYRTMGDYLGHALAMYEMFYSTKRVLVMGGVAGGPGGDLMLARAREVLKEDYGSTLKVDDPDEKVRQLGQSVAAAALPQIKC